MAAGKINLQANDGKIYSLTPEEGASGNVEHVLPKEGGVLTVDAEVVHKTGNETIAGVKTFSSDISGLSAITGKKVIMVDTENSRMLYLRYLLGFNRIDSYNSPITNATPLLINSSELHLQIDDSTKLKIDTSGNVLVTGSGGLGYGTGSGGTVTQLTSKSTAVTLNKPCGQIVMNNAALAAGSEVLFTFNNSTITPLDSLEITIDGTSLSISHQSYDIRKTVTNGAALITLVNRYGSSLSEAVRLNFKVLKGSNS